MERAVKISPFPHLDKAMERLQANKKKWVTLPLEKKISYLENIRKNLAEVIDDWTKDSLRFKGLDPESSENAVHLAYEYVNMVPLGYLINNQLSVLKKAKDLGNGDILFPKPELKENSNVGKQFFRVTPGSTADNLLQPGLTIDIWLEKGEMTQGKALREAPEGRVCVILGGGNVNIIPAADSIHKLFTENQVVMVKYNPVNVTPQIKNYIIFTN